MKSGYFVERKIRKEICSTGRTLYEKGYVAANDGNISYKLCEDEYLITPANVSKGAMKPSMIIKTDKNGKVLKGRSKVSSEYQMHLRVYKENPGIRAVVHAHPQVATSYAIAGEPLDKGLLIEAVVLLGVVPVAPYGTPGTSRVPDSIAPYCRGYNSVLMKNHGVLSWGKDLKEAFFRMDATENYARISMYSETVFKGKGMLSKSQIDELIEIRNSIGIKAGGTPKAGE